MGEMNIEEHIAELGVNPADLSENDKRAIARVVRDSYLFGTGILGRAVDGTFSDINPQTVRVEHVPAPLRDMRGR